MMAIGQEEPELGVDGEGGGIGGGGGGGAGGIVVGNGSSEGTPPEGGRGAGGKRVRSDAAEWSESAIKGLLDAFGARYIASHRGNLRGKDWADVTRAVNSRGITGTKSVEQCRNKIDNLKKRFKLEREKGGPSSWPWFRTLDSIVGGAPKRGGVPDGGAGGGVAGAGQSSDPNAASVHQNGAVLIPMEVLHLHQQQQQQQEEQQQQEQQGPVSGPPTAPSQLPQQHNGGGDVGQDESDPENVAETPYSSQRDSHTDFPSFKEGVGKDVMSEMTNPSPKVDAASGGGGAGKPNRKKRKNICHAGKDVAASIASFAELFAKVEFAKMEVFKDVELRRMEMQYKLAKLAHSRKKGRSTNSASSSSE